MRVDDQEFRPDASFVVRTPLLAFDEIMEWSASRPTLTDPGERLRAVFRRPEVREALFLASPKLESQLDLWLGGTDDPKLTRSLIRYFLRMSARPTPFGLFAGAAVGEIGGETKMAVSGSRGHRRKTRLDSHYLASLAARLESDEVLRKGLLFRPNTSLYRTGGRLRYAEVRIDGTRRYRLVAVEPSAALDTVLEEARSGASLERLAGSLVDDDISYDEAADFVNELIDSQILVSDLAPPVTCSEGIVDLIETLDAAGGHPTSAVLERVGEATEEIDRAGLGVSPGRYRELEAHLRPLGAEVDIGRLFQVDMVTDLDARIDGTTVEAIGRAIASLSRVMATGQQDAMNEFRRRFTERYGTRELPLVEVLDEESGIGFLASSAPAAEGSPLLAGLPFAAEDGPSQIGGRRHDHLLRMLIRAWSTGAMEIVLTDDDIEMLSFEDPIELPDAFGALVTLNHPDRPLIASLHGVSGPSGATLLGRFCLADQQMEETVRTHLRAEEELRSDAVFAEIVHLPEGRIGNVVARPVLRTYEIPFLGRSGAPDERLLPLEDLMVSVAGERIVLRSKRLGTEVLPRLTSAHNFTLRSLGVYRFLCSLQHQDCAGGVVWRWGAFEAAPFLPRIVIDRVVVARARWLIDGAVLDELLSGDHERMQDLRKRLNLPRFVALRDGDNELVIDLDNEAVVNTLLDLVRRRPYVSLVEMWPLPEDLIVQGPTGKHTNEVVLPFVRTRSPNAPRTPRRPRDETRRRFPPGSEWLYAKLYGGTSSVDELLRNLVEPIVAEAKGDGTCDEWFFVRYGDPQWHLRVRLHGDPTALSSQLLPALNGGVEREIAAGRIWRMQLDTYERELERYGGPVGMSLCERWFTVDSDAVLTALAALPGDAGMDLRWQTALVGIDALFSDFGFDSSLRSELAARMARGYEREFHAGGELKRSIGSRFRERRAQLEELLENRPAIFRTRSMRGRDVIDELRTADRVGKLSVPLPELATSLAHMHVNRMLRSEQRAHELVIYAFLERLYRAQVARAATRDRRSAPNGI